MPAKKQIRPGFRDGRPTKLTKKRAETIFSYIRLGSWYETACQAAGICKQTWNTWLTRGNDVLERMERGEKIADPVDRLYAWFVAGVNRAVAQAEVNALQRIDKAALAGIWQASAWQLERRFPERWAKQEQLVINNVDADIYIEQQLQTLAVLTGQRKEEVVAAVGPTDRVIEATTAVSGAAGNSDPMVQPSPLAQADPIPES